MIPLWPALLARSLRDDLLSEQQKLGVIFGLLLLQYIARVLRSQSQYSLPLVSAYLVISVIGTALAFRTNARGDNRNFIERWTCLHFSFSLLVVYIPQFLLYGIYVLLFWTYGAVIVTVSQKLYPIIMVMDISLLVLEYLLLNHFMRTAASGTPSLGETAFAPLAAP